MTENQAKLSGVFAPVVTPFQDDNLSLDDLRDNLKKLRETKLAGYLALGSNGEYKSLSDQEQFEILEVFAEEKGDKVVMVGTGCESTKQTIEKSRVVGQMGFDYVSVLTPHYFAKRMDGDTLAGYYERIADAVSIPVLIYNAPGFASGVKVPPKTLAALAKHPNIVGMKDSSPTGPAGFLTVLDPSDDFSVLAGSINFFYPSLHLGATGGVVSLSNALPEPCAKLYELFVAGRFEDAKALHVKLARLNQAVSGAGGVAGVKAAMEISGFKGGQPRHPLTAVTEQARKQMREAIAAAGLLS
ncbi:MAG: dihydrodipicolinate synthase family protein [Phycisphaerales bacterium]|nr:MAG: dihydrodipicolinate synthase family protein [Phycisphaerales bacterium]